MSNIRVSQGHSVSRDEAKAKLEGFADYLSKYRVSLAWNGHAAKVKGIGVSGDLQIGEAAVDVNVKLGMLARAAGIDATRLQGSIERRLKEAFEGE